MNKPKTEALFEQLRAAGTAGDYDDEADDLKPQVVPGDNRHFYVAFTLKGKGVWLLPEDARCFADELLTAADEAETRRWTGE